MADFDETRPATPAPFLTALPLELRSYIYTHLLVSSQPIKGPLARSHNSEKYDLHTAILRTCKQINLEARQIFFGKNTFCISSVPPTAASLMPRTAIPTEETNEVEREANAEEGEVEPELEQVIIEQHQQQQIPDPPTGAFEPPLQISDLHFVRHLELDLLYYPNQQIHLNPRDVLLQQQQRTGADRYLTNLSHLLTLTKHSLTTLSLTFDSRPHLPLPLPLPLPSSTSTSSPQTLNLKRYLLGPSSADTSPRFKSSLSSLSIPDVALRFEFPEARFDFKKVRREVLVESCLVSIVGQVLMARSEIGIRGVLEEIGVGEDEREV